MRLALHLARTDWSRLWPGLVALLGLVVLRTAAVELSMVPPADDPGRAMLLANAEPLLLMIEVAATVVAVATVVHRDPLVGRRAFWLTRPIPPRTLLLAKALVFSPLVLVPLLLNAARLMAYGAEVPAVVASSLQLALSRAAWIGVTWLIAAVTASTMGFILTGFAIWVTFVVYSVAAYNFSQNFSGGPPPIIVALPILPGSTNSSSWISLTAATAASAAILAWQYRARRRGAAIALLALTLFALANGGLLIPQRLTRAREPEPPAWSSALDVRLAGHRVSAESIARREPGRQATYFAGRLDVIGLPAEYTATVVPRTSRVSSDGVRVDGRGQPKTSEPPQRRLDLALANASLGGAQQARPTYSPGLGDTYVQVNDAHRLRPFLNRVVRIDAELEIWLTRHHLFATLPLRAGAAVRHGGALFEITHIRREGHQVVARIRHAAFPAFGRAPSPEIHLAVYESIERVWTSISQPRSFGDQFSGFGFYLALPLSPYSAPWASAWQSIHEVRAMEPGSVAFATWQRSLQLLLVESVYEGRINRRWSDDRVYVAVEPRK